MRHLDRALGTFATWCGAVGIIYLLHVAETLNGLGAAGIVLGAFISTMWIWDC